MFNKKTKWIVLGNYQYGGSDYVVFVRKNLKNGLLDFKIKNVHAWKMMSCDNILPNGLIDVKAQWDKIINQ